MPVQTSGGVKLVELLGSISLATDMGTGQPVGHGLRTAVVAAGLARQLGLGDGDVEVVRQVALLRFLGCTADTADTARMVGGDDLAFLADMAPVVMGGRMEVGRRVVTSVGQREPVLRRARLLSGAVADRDGMRRSLTSHCEVAARLARRLAVAPPVVEALGHGYERWDGAGYPDGLSGEAIPLPVRIAALARDADLLWRSVPGSMDQVLRARRGRGYDPGVVDAFGQCGRDLLVGLDSEDPWAAAVGDGSQRVLAGEVLDAALAAVGDFGDLKSPWTRGHSVRVCDLAVAAAEAFAAPVGDLDVLRRAAWVADVGRVGVPNGVWDRPGPLGVADWERVRLHPYLTERILTRCGSLAPVGRIAAAHHERLDGTGYHRGVKAHDLDAAMRLLAAADVVAAMGEARPHRPALASAQIAREVDHEVRAGRLDASAARAVMSAAGHARPGGRRTAGPHGLTEREVEVLRLIARGNSNREVAATLGVSPKTIGRHVENVYAKIGVSTRAAAALVAMEHRLLDG